MADIKDVLKQTQAGYIKHEIENEEGGVDIYMIKLLPSIQAWDMAEDIIGFITPVMGSIADGQEGYSEDPWLNVGLLVSKSLKELGLANRSVELLEGATRNGVKLDIARDFVGAKGLKALKELTYIALKENVLDFLLEELEKKGLEIPSLDSLMDLQQKTSTESSD